MSEDFARRRGCGQTNNPRISHAGWRAANKDSHFRFSYAPSSHVGPGHPVYERAAKAVADEARAQANDPEQIKRIQASLNTKIAQWTHELVDEWNAQVREYNAAQGTALPTLGKDGKLNFPDEN